MSKESCDLPVGKTCGLKTVGDQIIENFYRLFLSKLRASRQVNSCLSAYPVGFTHFYLLRYPIGFLR